MKIYFTFLLPLLLALASQADSSRSPLHCTAIYRSLDERNESIEKTARLRPLLVTKDFTKYAARLEGKAFYVTEQSRSGNLFAQILGTGEARGSLARGTTDELGRFTASEVAGVSVYRVECSRR